MTDGWLAELALPPDIRYVGLARVVVATAARQEGIDLERVEDLRVAVSEALTNAVQAHASAARSVPVTLRFGLVADGVFEVSVDDAGQGFDSEAVERPPQDADDLREEGMGLLLIRNLADEVAFEREGGMRVRMRFGEAANGSGPAGGSGEPAGAGDHGARAG